jgi:hypothetical protein
MPSRSSPRHLSQRRSGRVSLPSSLRFVNHRTAYGQYSHKPQQRYGSTPNAQCARYSVIEGKFLILQAPLGLDLAISSSAEAASST